MAQLPPKIPTIAQNWPSFPTTTTQYFQQQNSPPPPPMPSWVDDFLSFSSSRRGAHRRSASDSIAFLETAFLDECRNPATAGSHPAATGGFDRLDDDQLMSMFSDDINNTTNNNGSSLPPSSATASLSNPSTPSDHNSNNDEKPMVVDDVVPAVPEEEDHYLHPKNEPGEVESACNNDTDTQPPPFSAAGDSIIDPKRVKRILANRQSAQRSRVRKLQYISELERSVSTLQTEVSALSPRVAFLDHQRLILNVDNSALKQRIAALAQDKIFKDAHHEALKKEIERLRQIYQQQSLQKMEKSVNNNNNNNTPSSHSHPQGCTDNERAPPMLMADQTTFT